MPCCCRRWAKLDTVIASDSIVSTEILTSRVKWLEEMHMTFKKLQEDLDGECRKDYEPLRQYMSAAKKQAELEIMNIRDCPDMFRHVEHHHTGNILQICAVNSILFVYAQAPSTFSIEFHLIRIYIS